MSPGLQAIDLDSQGKETGEVTSAATVALRRKSSPGLTGPLTWLPWPLPWSQEQGPSNLLKELS